MSWKGKWIKPERDMGNVCPAFIREWIQDKMPTKAELLVTALGVYSAYLNGKRISDYVLAPGWTSYDKRLQYQVYDITEFLEIENYLEIIVGKGWYRSPMLGCDTSEKGKKRMKQPAGVYGEVHIQFEDGTEQMIFTNDLWKCRESPVRFSEIYDGESFDAAAETKKEESVEEFNGPSYTLIQQEGEAIKEQEIIQAKQVIVTPRGETVIDFGQEVTGYIEIQVNANAGERIRILHGEMLDEDGNFYNENYRSAKAEINYICKTGEQKWHPLLTFFGFRYIKIEEFPGKVEKEHFCAIAVYSDMKRTGYLSCSEQALNQLFSNVFWGQRCNFLDVPTDCPQRDERLGWTGDAQVFIKTACYNFDVENFFAKWLRDLGNEQAENGAVFHVVPDWFENGQVSAAWGDAAVICPWQLYVCYGSLELLGEFYKCMKKWVDYITNVTTEQYLWSGGTHFGDWLGLDAASGSYKGRSRDDFIASAYYAYSTALFIKAGNALGNDMEEYEQLYHNILNAFRKEFPECRTQTEYVLSIWFELSSAPQEDADKLVGMIKSEGESLKTGFVGTPYLLHVLSKYGHIELAYSLLLKKHTHHGYIPWIKGQQLFGNTGMVYWRMVHFGVLI